MDGRIGLEWILGRLVGRMYSESSWLRLGVAGGLL
jgi:hypothetical protein